MTRAPPIARIGGMTAELRSPARPRSPARRRWLGPVGLILMSVIPIAGGAALLTELARGAHVTPANARFFAEPLPVAVHIVCASTYILLGPLQFIPGFRRRLPGWHRIAGRVLIPAGILAALAGLWMVVYYPLAPGDDELLRYVRLVFGSALAGSLVLGYIAVRHRDFAAHRAWMIRGYAVAQGAGTQALIGIPWLLIAGQPAEYLPRTLMLTAGWVINVAVAELIIRRPGAGRRALRAARRTSQQSAPWSAWPPCSGPATRPGRRGHASPLARPAPSAPPR
jgi:hypothetical protein